MLPYDATVIVIARLPVIVVVEIQQRLGACYLSQSTDAVAHPSPSVSENERMYEKSCARGRQQVHYSPNRGSVDIQDLQ